MKHSYEKRNHDPWNIPSVHASLCTHAAIASNPWFLHHKFTNFFHIHHNYSHPAELEDSKKIHDRFEMNPYIMVDLEEPHAEDAQSKKTETIMPPSKESFLNSWIYTGNSKCKNTNAKIKHSRWMQNTINKSRPVTERNWNTTLSYPHMVMIRKSQLWGFLSVALN